MNVKSDITSSFGHGSLGKLRSVKAAKTPILHEAHIFSGDAFMVEDPRWISETQGSFSLPPELYGSDSLPMEDFLHPPSFETSRHTSTPKKSISLHQIKLPKKRPSIQSLFTPSFLQASASSPTIPSPSASTIPPRSRSLSVATRTDDYTAIDSLADAIESPSLTKLLDDDPFANLTATSPTKSPVKILSTSASRSALRSPPSAYPSSPPTALPSRPSTLHGSSSASKLPLYRPTLARPRSSGHGQARPAHTKPAFAPRPSLPSLHTLAQMNIVIPKKARKGRPGARLPYEPWNLELGIELDVQQGNTSLAGPSQARTAPAEQERFKSSEQDVDDFTLTLGSVESRAFSQDALPSGSAQLIHPANELERDNPALYHSMSMDDLDVDSLPSLSYTASEPSSSALSRSSSMASSSWSEALVDQNSAQGNRSQAPSLPAHIDDYTSHPTDDLDDDPLSYHSDFDYYTQQLSESEDSESDTHWKTRPRPRSRSPDVGATPYTSLYSADAAFEPGTSAGTMRSVLQERAPVSSHPISTPADGNKAQDSGEWRGQQSRGYHNSSRRTFDGGERNHGGGGHGNRSGGPGDNAAGGHGRGGDDGDDDDKGRRPPAQSSFSSASEDSSSSEEEGDAGTVYYSIDGVSSVSLPRSGSRTRSIQSNMPTGSDDDVPLAQRIPTALTAQRTIRKQVRDERQQRRLERASKNRDIVAPKEQPVAVPLPPRGATHGRQRSMSAAPAPISASLRRERTRPKPAPIDAFPAEDLTKKLMSLKGVGSPPATAPLSSDAAGLLRIKAPGSGARSPLSGQAIDQMAFLQQLPPLSADKPSHERTLRPTRSFHRSDKRSADPSPAPPDPPSSSRLGRSSTTAQRRPADDSFIRGGENNVRGVSESASGNVDQLSRVARRSEDSRRPAVITPRTSTERNRENDSPVQRDVQRPPVPPLPPAEVISSMAQQAPAKIRTTQQRVFVGDMQRFNMVEISPNTSAGDVIDLVASQGALDKSTGWMLWELAQDFGMERPIRSYELLSDVTASWNKDKMLNAFVIKKTPLALLLSRSNMPTSSPTNRGYVEWESKRGKWSKRWMELREHSLWLSKRDTGKDETFLCSLSNFDVYYVTRRHKSPKPFVFAIKSTDNLTLFEDASDYLHVFSCNQKDGEKWMEAILVARSYVLYQERHVLFAKPGETTAGSKSLSRSRTRKQSSAVRPTQPLVQVAPPSTTSTPTVVAFEPGSLLAKRKGDTQP